VTDHDTAENDRLAQIAARILDKIGDAAVNTHRRPRRIRPPAPGRAVLACGCGQVMDADQMRRLPMSLGDSTFIRPIVCGRCAT
jgi:hypothetical protein